MTLPVNTFSLVRGWLLKSRTGTEPMRVPEGEGNCRPKTHRVD